MSITKIASQGAADVARIAARSGGDAAELARDLIAKNTNMGGLNLKEAGLAEDMVRLAKRDPDLAEAVRGELRGQLSGSNYRQVSEATPAAALRVEDEALAARGVPKADRAKILDMVQMGFDVAGIFDPTPISDGISGAISLARGDWLGAGISAVSMVPYVGDLAKAGKIGKWAQTVANGAELVAKYGADSLVGKQALAAISKIGGAIDAIPARVLDALPASTKAQLDATKAAVDGALARASGRGVADAAGAGLRRADGTVNLERAAARYAEVVESNKPWSWGDDFGEKFTARERREIRNAAIESGAVPAVPMKPGTKYPDFAAAGAVRRVDALPEALWTASDRAQFKWLDDRIPGGRPEGTTWHHSEVDGRMELVDFGVHNIVNHKGGRSKGHWAHAPR